MLARVAHGDALRLLILGDAGIDSGALDLLQTIKERHPDFAVLLVSAHPTIEHATESIRRGAEDFVPVPYSEEIVSKEVARILEAAELRERVDSLDRLVVTRYGFGRIVSRSARMNAVLDRATAASRSDTPVLIVGETGTGKELTAGPQSQPPADRLSRRVLPVPGSQEALMRWRQSLAHPRYSAFGLGE